MIKVAVSGGFDPLHSAHLDHMEEARRLGDWLVVILNTDECLIRKKGWVGLPLLERMRLIETFPFVDQVVISIDRDQTVANTIRLIKPNIFAKGGDRNPEKVPIPQSELDACKEVGCKMVYGVDRGVRASSSDFYLEAARIINKPWGYEKVLYEDDVRKVKVLHVFRGEELSLQSHKSREERWRVVEGFPIIGIDGKEKLFSKGDYLVIPAGITHQVKADQSDITLIEVSNASLKDSESDIVRHKDKYHRTEEG